MSLCLYASELHDGTREGLCKISPMLDLCYNIPKRFATHAGWI